MSQEEEFKHFVRIVNTDLDGNKQIYRALTKIKGIGAIFANAVCNVSNIERNKKIGYITEEETKKIEEIIRNPEKFNFPKWMFNRRKDYDTGEDKHLLTSDLVFARDNDIKMLKKIKAYKGMRHALGQPVRGQRTKSNFRKGKALGVAKGKAKSGRV